MSLLFSLLPDSGALDCRIWRRDSNCALLIAPDLKNPADSEAGRFGVGHLPF